MLTWGEFLNNVVNYLYFDYLLYTVSYILSNFWWKVYTVGLLTYLYYYKVKPKYSAWSSARHAADFERKKKILKSEEERIRERQQVELCKAMKERDAEVAREEEAQRQAAVNFTRQKRLERLERTAPALTVGYRLGSQNERE